MQSSVAALLVVTGAVASSCGGDDFCAAGSYECSTMPTAGMANAGSGGSGGSNAGTGGSTGQSGADSGGTAGSTVTGGTAGSGVGAGMGGQAGEAGGGGMAGSGGASGSGDAGMGGVGPVTCDPTDLSPGCILKTTGAIFVAPSAQGGDDAHDGTQGAPVLTVTKAISLAAGVNIPIYVCAGTYKEHVEVTADNIALRGGFTCDASVWTYDRGKRARIAPSTKDEALRVTDVTGLEVTDLELVSANATTPGASSVAIFVSGSEDVVFTRLHVVAGNGADGENGTLEGFAYADSTALEGYPAVDETAGPQQLECPLCAGTTVVSVGGQGGIAEQNGTSGKPLDLGGGAAGQVDSMECTSGGRGADAPAAIDGAGADMTGSLVSSGWTPLAGVPGDNGGPGQGGGGGGGAPVGKSGAGGGGACGGCGGKGGGGGTGGGASIAILVLESNVAVLASTLDTAAGGSGGEGAAGQVAQDGGLHGNGSNFGCDGGNGGNGGNGGAGGGGAGGISVGIVSTMSTVSVDTRTLITPGTPGEGGLGGGDMNSGIAGVAQTQLVL